MSLFKPWPGGLLNNFSPKVSDNASTGGGITNQCPKSAELFLIGSAQPLGWSTYDKKNSVAAESTGPGLRTIRVTSGWWGRERIGWVRVDKGLHKYRIISAEKVLGLQLSQRRDNV